MYSHRIINWCKISLLTYTFRERILGNLQKYTKRQSHKKDIVRKIRPSVIGWGHVPWSPMPCYRWAHMDLVFLARKNSRNKIHRICEKEAGLSSGEHSHRAAQEATLWQMWESDFRDHTWSALGQIDNPRPHALCLRSIAEVTPVENILNVSLKSQKLKHENNSTNIKTNNRV